MSLRLPDNFRPLLDAPVAVLGGGVSGAAVRELVTRLGGAAKIYDERAGVGDDSRFDVTEASGHRLVVFSPGFRPGHPWLRVAAAAHCASMGELDFASLLWKGRLVAITGTNGKTTLTEFLSHALRSTGREATATGNIGYSFSRLVAERDGGRADDYAVCEVSSFQAEVMKHFRADSVIWTNFAEDHLERHGTLHTYFAAKNQLVLRSPGVLVLVGSSVRAYAQRFGLTMPSGSFVPTEGLFPDPRLEGTVFAEYPQRENFVLASAWWARNGLPEQALYEAAESFRLGRHRLAIVAEIGGVRWWNDSKATNFHAVESALARFREPVLLIAGGRAKGGNLDGFVARIAPKVRQVFLIGETSATLAEACVRHQVAYTLCPSLKEAIEAAGHSAVRGDHVLLSPGFASFDMFRSYEHRGDVFEQEVRAFAGRALDPLRSPYNQN